MPALPIWGVVMLGVLIWAWRYWALRTWRTIAVPVLGFVAASVSWLTLPTPYGLLIGSVFVGVAAWLVLSGSGFLRAVSDVHYVDAERLRVADQEAAHVLSAVGESVEPAMASVTLARIIDGLRSVPHESPWAPVRDLKLQELELGQLILAGASNDLAADVARQRDLCTKARDQFLVTRRSVSRFW